MNSKLVCLSLAGLMTMQSAAFAQSDRTSLVTNQAITQAHHNIAAMRSDLTKLDQALALTAERVKNRENAGSISNIIAMSSAGLGIATMAIGFMSTNHYITALKAAMALTLVSSAAGTYSSFAKKDIDVDQVNRQLETIEQQIASDKKTADQNQSAALNEMSRSISALRESLDSYQTRQSVTDYAKLSAHLSQFFGTAIFTIGTIAPVGVALMSGSVMMSVGNLTRIISGLTNTQAEEVLLEITKTREALKAAAAELE